MKRQPRVLFFGMPGNFSLPCLQALWQEGIEVCALVIPASPDYRTGKPAIARKEAPNLARPMLPVLNASLQMDIVQLAWQRGIPVLEVERMSDPVVISTLVSYEPDMICVACFPLRIPRTILEIPALGCLDVHPSLLPDNRGPVPLFWTFRRGDRQTGVSIHLMEDKMDAGDILAQVDIPVPEGISYDQLEARCAARGGELLAQTVWELYEGRAVRVPQDETRSSYYPFPTDEDFIVPVAEWDAAHVYNFICGLAGWGQPIKLQLSTGLLEVQRAISYSHEGIDIGTQEVYPSHEGRLEVPCRTGWVEIQK